MASWLLLSLSVLLCAHVAHSQQSSCSMSSLPRARSLLLSQFAGTWYEIRFSANSEDIAPADVWKDVTETYILDEQVPNKVNITYNFRDQNGKCSTIVSQRSYKYNGNSEFKWRKWNKEYTQIVTLLDNDYQYVVLVACETNDDVCPHVPDVKILHRNARPSDSFYTTLATFFRERLPCINYNSLLTITRTTNPCTLQSSTKLQRFSLQRDNSWWQLASFRQFLSFLEKFVPF